MTCTMIGPSAL